MKNILLSCCLFIFFNAARADDRVQVSDIAALVAYHGKASVLKVNEKKRGGYRFENCSIDQAKPFSYEGNESSFDLNILAKGALAGSQMYTKSSVMPVKSIDFSLFGIGWVKTDKDSIPYFYNTGNLYSEKNYPTSIASLPVKVSDGKDYQLNITAKDLSGLKGGLYLYLQEFDASYRLIKNDGKSYSMKQEVGPVNDRFSNFSYTFRSAQNPADTQNSNGAWQLNARTAYLRAALVFADSEQTDKCYALSRFSISPSDQFNSPATVQKIYVNNLTGNDSYDGRSNKVTGKSGPFKTLQKALNEVDVSGYVDIANTGIPYPAGNRLKKGGTTDLPLVIEGNHAVINGLEELKLSDWEPVEKDIYRTAFWPMSNYLKINKDYNSWVGSPDIWKINGQTAKNCNSKEELLSTPGGFWWNKAEKMVWMHLPNGVLLSELKISIPSKRGTGFNVSGDAAHIIVRNLRSEYSSNDGFSAHDQVSDLIFKNCIAVNNCGQGFSMHGNTRVVVEDGLSRGNASSGACDVGFAEVLYRRCAFIANTFEAGVFAAENTKVTYQDCLIINNEPFEQLWQKGQSVMTFINCMIQGKGKTAASVQMGKLIMEHCTLKNFDKLIVFQDPRGRMEIKNCLAIGADASVSRTGDWDGPGARLPVPVLKLYKDVLNNKLSE